MVVGWDGGMVGGRPRRGQYRSESCVCYVLLLCERYACIGIKTTKESDLHLLPRTDIHDTCFGRKNQVAYKEM